MGSKGSKKPIGVYGPRVCYAQQNLYLNKTTWGAEGDFRNLCNIIIINVTISSSHFTVWTLLMLESCCGKQIHFPIFPLQWRHNGAMASQITSLTILYSTVYSSANQRKHQSAASLVFVRGTHQWTVNSSYKWPVTRKMFPFDDVSKHKIYRPSRRNTMIYIYCRSIFRWTYVSRGFKFSSSHNESTYYRRIPLKLVGNFQMLLVITVPGEVLGLDR